jgi:hypothetical protein
LNTISMRHPHIPIEHPNCFVVNDSEFSTAILCNLGYG